MKLSLRQYLAALVLEVPTYCYYLVRSRPISESPAWLYIHNRGEALEPHENHIGLKCNWKWTSDLYLPKVFPVFAKRLFAKALNTFPIALSGSNTVTKSSADVSFIIGHRGKSRIDLLLKTIKSIAAQESCSVECIVVEQDVAPLVKDCLPEWVSYIFTPVDKPDTAYSRSWAFNVGAKHASADCLIFHDNDLLIPRCYARHTFDLYQRGFEFINLKRFIFYLSKESSSKFVQEENLDVSLTIDSIMQNAEGGGSIGASKKAFQTIGGFDERFIGWGGEDTEFWERAITQNAWLFGYLPLVHLWHESQSEKLSPFTSETKALYDRLSEIPATQRIADLLANSENRGTD